MNIFVSALEDINLQKDEILNILQEEGIDIGKDYFRSKVHGGYNYYQNDNYDTKRMDKKLKKLTKEEINNLCDLFMIDKNKSTKTKHKIIKDMWHEEF